MTITNGYATLAQVLWRLGGDLDGWAVGDDTTRDAVMEGQVQAISRVIDGITGHEFYATSSEDRYYTAQSPRLCYVDDLVSIATGLYTDLNADLTYATTWAATDYLLMPLNAVAKGWPYSWIELSPTGNYTFPTGIRGVKITTAFGFCATGSQPDEITEACCLMVEQLFKRKDAIFGVTGPMGMSFALKVTMMNDPTIMTLLDTYIDKL